jgi:HK97 family phage prohead protease
MAKNLQLVSYKGFSFEPQNINEQSRTISGYASIFNYKDSDGDVMLPGAFARSIAQRGPNSATNGKIALLNQHDMRNPLGRITKLIEDEKGLYFEAEIDNIPEGDRLITQLKSGTINQFSIGFKYIKDQMHFDRAQKTYFIKDVDLFEISPVTLGANEATQFLGFKSAATQSDVLYELDMALKQLALADEYTIRALVEKYLNLEKETIKKEPIEKKEDTIDYNTLFCNVKFI